MNMQLCTFALICCGGIQLCVKYNYEVKVANVYLRVLQQTHVAID